MTPKRSKRVTEGEKKELCFAFKIWSVNESVFPHDRFGFNRKIKETREANFSDQGGFFFRSSHDTLCADPPPLRIFFEGRGVCAQDIPMINAQFRHEYSTVFLSLAWFA